MNTRHALMALSLSLVAAACTPKLPQDENDAAADAAANDALRTGDAPAPSADASTPAVDAPQNADVQTTVDSGVPAETCNVAPGAYRPCHMAGDPDNCVRRAQACVDGHWTDCQPLVGGCPQDDAGTAVVDPESCPDVTALRSCTTASGQPGARICGADHRWGTVCSPFGSADAGVTPADSGVPVVDSGVVDTGVLVADAGSPDVGTDTGPVDVGAIPADSGVVDSGVTDSGSADAGPCTTDLFRGNIGQVCTNGLHGVCMHLGVFVCDPVLNHVVCNAASGTGTTETCNGLDDDCNGLVDDGLGTVSCGNGACLRTVNRCVAGVLQVCTPPTEVCGNGIDDNCNGQIDEGCPVSDAGVTPDAGPCPSDPSRNLIGAVCTNGLRGACARNGAYVCNAATGRVECNAPTATGTTETCNGIDDDCNGLVDDMGTVSCGNGACMRTLNRCQGGVLQVCTPPTEICGNGIDDDCNGLVDDGCPSARWVYEVVNTDTDNHFAGVVPQLVDQYWSVQTCLNNHSTSMEFVSSAVGYRCVVGAPIDVFNFSYTSVVAGTQRIAGVVDGTPTTDVANCHLRSGVTVRVYQEGTTTNVFVTDGSRTALVVDQCRLRR